MDNKDSITTLPVGAVGGPYLDAGAYVLAKKIATRQIPDSVKVRHILIGTIDPNTGAPIRPDSVAKKTADSLFMVIKAGGNFGVLAAQFSDDQGSKNNGGEYDFSSINLDLAKNSESLHFTEPLVVTR